MFYYRFIVIHRLRVGRLPGAKRQQADHGHFKRCFRIRRDVQVPATVQGKLVVELDILFIESAGQCAADLVNLVRTVRQYLCDRDIMQDGQQLSEHSVIIRSQFGHVIDPCEHGRGIPFDNIRKQGAQLLPVNRSQHVTHLSSLKAAVAKGYGLIKQAQRITHTAIGRVGKQAGTGSLCCDLLLFQDFVQLGFYLPLAQVFQVELQTTGQDGDGYLFRFGRRQQEFYMLRRFLQGLQQGIETVLGEHVHFINEVDLVPAGSGRILYVIHQVPGFIHLGPRCRVDFN